jgi:hypothetical protein
MIYGLDIQRCISSLAYRDNNHVHYLAFLYPAMRPLGVQAYYRRF